MSDDPPTLLDKASEDCGQSPINCPERLDVTTLGDAGIRQYVHGDCEPPNKALAAALRLAETTLRRRYESHNNHDLYGLRFHGFAEGWFGNHSFTCRTVECVGADWVVVRDDEGAPQCLSFTSRADMRSTLLALAGKRTRLSGRGGDDLWCCEHPGPVQV